MYRAIGLLKQDHDFDLDTAAARVVAKIPGSTSTRSGEVVTIAKGDWTIYITLVRGPHVQFETEGIVAKLAGLEISEAETVIGNDCRVEVWTDNADPQMEHFNDYLYVVEVLKSFNGVMTVDPNEPSLL